MKNIKPPGVNEGETFIDTISGEKIVFPSTSIELDGVSYVRFINGRGVELLRYESNEWYRDPKGVMGAILGAMLSGSNPFRN